MRAFFARHGRFGGCLLQSHVGSAARRVGHWLIAMFALVTLAPAVAQETTTYTYDARGQLVTVNHGTTGPNANVVSNYTYDAAENRCAVNITTSGSGSSVPCPSLTISPTTLPNGTIGVTYNQPLSANGGTGTGYSFSVSSGSLPAGLNLSTTGSLSGTPATAASYSFWVKAVDSGGNSGSQPYSVTIAHATLSLTPTTLPGGTVGSAYSQTIHASGGSGTGYNFSATGTLPTGLALNSSSGLLSGTPSVAGTYSFTINASDSAGDTGSRSYSVTVAHATLSLSPTTLPNGTVGTGYSQTISARGGTGTGYSFSLSAGTLPSGLTLTTGGLISGSPNTAGAYSFTIKATDSASDTGTQSYSVSIAASTGPCSAVGYTINNNEVVEGSPLTFTITKSGSTSSSCSVSYATANGTAVAGTNYLATSGTLTFTATQTTQTVTVTTYGGKIAKGTRTMYLNLSNPTAGASLTNSQGIGTLDSDGSICLTC